MMKRGFTLLELIVVIVIIGVLATLGLRQYDTVVERGRSAEARANLGFIRKRVYEYWYKNNTLTGMKRADLGLSENPGACDAQHYFFYLSSDPPDPDSVTIYAYRCCPEAGRGPGKPPDGSTYYGLSMTVNPGTGQDTAISEPFHP